MKSFQNQEAILSSKVVGYRTKLVLTEFAGTIVYVYRVTVEVTDGHSLELMVSQTRFHQLLQQEGLSLSQYLQQECRPLWDDGRMDRRTLPRIVRALSRLRLLFRWKA